MELFDELYRQRPTSLPTSLLTSPTSPGVTCCSCRYLSRSSNDILKKFPIGNTAASAKKKWGVRPRIPLSIFKSKEKNSGSDLIGVGNGTTASCWAFSQAFERPQNGFQLKETSLRIEKEKSKVITPTYQTTVGFQMEQVQNHKEQDEQHLTTKSNNAKLQNCADRSDLRNTLLANGLASRGVGPLLKADIPRSPGPLDGSLYAQVRKKKKSTKDSTMSIVSSNRGYHSAEELSTPQPPQDSNEIDADENFPLFTQEASSSTTQNIVGGELTTSITYSIERKSNFTEQESKFKNITDSGYQTIASVSDPVGQPGTIKEAPISGELELSQDIKNTNVSNSVAGNANENNRKMSLSDPTAQEKGGSEVTAKTEKVLMNEDASSNLGKNESGDKLMISNPASDSANMRPQAKKQPTKEEVRDAVALINECLTDQEIRNGSLTPEDPKLSVHEIAEPSLSGVDICVPEQEIFDSNEPEFSPAPPDYTSTEINQLYANKSPEYALPDRDLIHKSLPMRTAQIRVQEKTLASPPAPNKHLDDAFNDVVAPRHAPNQAMLLRKDRDLTVTSQGDSCLGSVPGQSEHLRKTTSSSDVDSGIEGSALNASSKSASKTSPTVERITNTHPTNNNCISNVDKTPREENTSTTTPLGIGSVEEDEEERKVREEIEQTQKRLALLHEQQEKLKKLKEEKAKRRSLESTSKTFPTQPGTKPAVISATLPRRPGHLLVKDEEDIKLRRPSPQEEKDVEELLRSVREDDYSSTKNENKITIVTKQSAMTSSALPMSQHLHKTSPGYKVAGTGKQGNHFTPAYAHPMHQPQQMNLHHYQRLNQDEERKRESMERWRIQEREKHEREQKRKEIQMQEKKREEERAEQEKFQQEFQSKITNTNFKSKQLPQETFKQPQKQSPQVQPPLPAKKRPSLSSSTRAKPPVSPSVVSPTISSHRKQLQATTSTAQVKSEELQSQLDELDRYIAQLTQNMEDLGTDNPTTNLSPRPNKTGVTVRKRRSFSIELERKMDPSIPLSPVETSSSLAPQVSPPKPPSRTRSSFISVSRRLSHGFELAQVMRQNSMDRDARRSAKDDDVFTQGLPQPSYPPQTRHTRPIQQQIATRMPVQSVPSPPTPQKMANLEDRLSPQLFLAMAVNPGARPVEEIHSYKEDLEPEPPGEDVVDGPPGSTPLFPVSPATPYVNNPASPVRTPAGLAKTPLSALGLKPARKTDQESPELEKKRNEGCPHGGTTQQQDSRVNGMTSESNSGVSKANAYQGGAVITNRVDNSNHAAVLELYNQGVQQAEKHHLSETKSSLVNNPSHDSGYADTNPQSSNGWIQSSADRSFQNPSRDVKLKNAELKSPWIHSGSSSSQSSTPGGKSPGLTFAYPSTSGEVSSNASRSLTGSSDSLLSNGSSSQHPHYAYQQQRLDGSHPSLPPKETSTRNSASSIRSCSTGGSGYLGGTSRTSPHSASSPASSAPGQYPMSQPLTRRESQLSSYEKHGAHLAHHITFSDDTGMTSPTSIRTSSSSTSDVDRLSYDVSNSSISGGSTPKFIKDTTSYWYKPDITREQALAMLRNRLPGSFVVRDSRCYPGAFGLALKVHQVPAAVLATAKPGTDMNNELVRHFLIEPSSRGVKLKGCINEPVFGSLSALIYQHSITPLALPCKLVVPTENQEVPVFVGHGQNNESANAAAELLRQGAACNVLYLLTVDTESLTGPEAIDRAMRELLQTNVQDLKMSVVHFKVAPPGITLTDNARKIFFRRHYPTATVTYCGLDPKSRDPRRRWDATKYRGPAGARVFGFVAKKPGSIVDNDCHLFAELDLDQPAPAIVNFVSKLLLSST